jgi:hypothetical protein
MHGENRISFRLLVEKSERKRSLGITEDRWKVNIKVDFGEIG